MFSAPTGHSFLNLFTFDSDRLLLQQFREDNCQMLLTNFRWTELSLVFSGFKPSLDEPEQFGLGLHCLPRHVCPNVTENMVRTCYLLTVNVLKFRTAMFQTRWHVQTVQTQIRLLLKEQSDQGLHC